jgi:hypothetical protein
VNRKNLGLSGKICGQKQYERYRETKGMGDFLRVEDPDLI